LDDMSVLNPTILYLGEISDSATSSPFMLMRQPLANVKRQPPKHFSPAFAGIDLKDSLPHLLGVVSQLARPEYRSFVANYEDEYGRTCPASNPADLPEPCRFPPLEDQLKAEDVRFRQNKEEVSMDWVMSNSVHVAPYHGHTVCPYCTMVIEMKGISSVTNHLVSKHAELQFSAFTCPTCLDLKILRWSTYERHWQDQHHAAAALTTVMCETNVSARYCWGQALAALAAAFNTAGVLFPANGIERVKYASEVGGYCKDNTNDVRELLHEIVEMRKTLVASQSKKILDEAIARDEFKRGPQAKRLRPNTEASPGYFTAEYTKPNTGYKAQPPPTLRKPDAPADQQPGTSGTNQRPAQQQMAIDVAPQRTAAEVVATPPPPPAAKPDFKKPAMPGLPPAGAAKRKKKKAPPVRVPPNLPSEKSDQTIAAAAATTGAAAVVSSSGPPKPTWAEEVEEEKPDTSAQSNSRCADRASAAALNDDLYARALGCDDEFENGDEAEGYDPDAPYENESILDEPEPEESASED